MAGLERRTDRGLAAILPEKRLTIHSDGAARQITISPISQLLLGLGGVALLGWMTFSTAAFVSGAVLPSGDAGATSPLRAAYSDRLDQLAAERDQRAKEASSTQGRFQIAMDEISRQQSDLLAAESERRELAAALDAMRDRLGEAVTARDAAAAASERMRAAATEAAARASSGGDLDDTVRALADELRDTAEERDKAAVASTELTREVTEMKLRADVAAKRQDQMIDQVEQAVAMSFGPLNRAVKSVDIDVDHLLDTVRENYSGQGGPLTPTVSTRNYDAGIDNSRLNSMMIDLDRMNLLRVAASKVPLAMPVHDSFRFTSSFGVRRDPKGAGRRMHAGLDLAAPKGTAIFSTADGVVVDAGPERGYGNVVRIRHELGFETIYAHLSKINVRTGQKISRADQIGAMGTTGRSTGVHLHYEVRLNGKPVNPMPYLEAARDVQ
jgi:murein DD-endopeptidase MepM/ murein hydrolase activator NlpD